VKTIDRRAILRSLGCGSNEVELDKKIIRGRRLDRAKLERWKKIERIASGGCQDREVGAINTGGQFKSSPATERIVLTKVLRNDQLRAEYG
jgi:hypothetical protein